MKVITIDDLYRYSHPVREWDDNRIINMSSVDVGCAIDIVRCFECKYCVPPPEMEDKSIMEIEQDIRERHDYDRVCTYWMSDGLKWDDFCSKGVGGEYEGGSKKV